MNKEYKCAMCGSVSKDVPGTCCGAERKEVASNVCLACQTGKGEHTHGDGHDHDKKEAAGVCLACQGGKGEHTCGM
ncbi:MAG: hypothetical protein Q8Q18_03410 [bacterium]|nr:hypothetical protein [bacterium]